MDDKPVVYTRRDFFRIAGYAAMGLAYWSIPGWMRAAALKLGKSSKKTVVVLFQRGAADGLNMVVPFADSHYRRQRPTIALAEPGRPGGVLDLDGRFGLHPALEALMPLWKQGHMALIHAAGCPLGTRSHFDAQDNMETGTPGLNSTPDGWLNRALAGLPMAGRNPLTALAVSPRLPRLLRGGFPVTTFSSLKNYQFAGGGASGGTFEKMYEGNVDLVLSGAGRETGESVKMLHDILKKEDSRQGLAGYGKDKISGGFSDLARVIKAGKGLRAGFIDAGGWDHHYGEGGNDGLLAARLGELGQGIASFYRDLGDKAEDVLLVTMTEFGRTLQENGDRGTDHGHGGVMMLFGGGVKGGRVYGRWPGLEKENLFEGRDLEVTTDFRQVFSEVLDKHLDLPVQEAVFPGFKPGPELGFL